MPRTFHVRILNSGRFHACAKTLSTWHLAFLPWRPLPACRHYFTLRLPIAASRLHNIVSSSEDPSIQKALSRKGTLHLGLADQCPSLVRPNIATRAQLLAHKSRLNRTHTHLFSSGSLSKHLPRNYTLVGPYLHSERLPTSGGDKHRCSVGELQRFPTSRCNLTQLRRHVVDPTLFVKQCLADLQQQRLTRPRGTSKSRYFIQDILFALPCNGSFNGFFPAHHGPQCKSYLHLPASLT